MNAMIDIVGAAIIGGLLLLTMLNALFNVQALAFDIHQQILLTETSEILARVVGDYISLAGAGVAGVILDSTGVSRFRFQTNDSTFTSTLRTYEIVQQDSMNMGFPLEAYIDGNRVMGTFYLSDSLHISYFDADNNELPFTNGFIASGDLVNIRFLEVTMEFFYDAISPSSPSAANREDPKNRIVLRQYLLNMYF